jgi:hypothetical protein
MCAPFLEITHQNAPAFFTANHFIFSQTCNALQFNVINCEVTPFALVTDKGGGTSPII